MDELLANKVCETCGEPATCGVVDMTEGGWTTGPDGVPFWARFSGEHSTHYFCPFHERPGRVHRKAARPLTQAAR